MLRAPALRCPATLGAVDRLPAYPFAAVPLTVTKDSHNSTADIVKRVRGQTTFSMDASFQTTVRNHFSFLERRGFSVVLEGPASIRYESARALVLVDRDWRSGEMNVWLGLRPEGEAKEVKYSLTDLLAMEKVSSPIAARPYEVYSDKELTPFVEDMAKCTEIYAARALDGDQAYFRELSSFRRPKKERNLP